MLFLPKIKKHCYLEKKIGYPAGYPDPAFFYNRVIRNPDPASKSLSGTALENIAYVICSACKKCVHIFVSGHKAAFVTDKKHCLCYIGRAALSIVPFCRPVLALAQA